MPWCRCQRSQDTGRSIEQAAGRRAPYGTFLIFGQSPQRSHARTTPASACTDTYADIRSKSPHVPVSHSPRIGRPHPPSPCIIGLSVPHTRNDARRKYRTCVRQGRPHARPPLVDPGPRCVSRGIRRCIASQGRPRTADAPDDAGSTQFFLRGTSFRGGTIRDCSGRQCGAGHVNPTCARSCVSEGSSWTAGGEGGVSVEMV
jgi:hypothetical protein